MDIARERRARSLSSVSGAASSRSKHFASFDVEWLELPSESRRCLGAFERFCFQSLLSKNLSLGVEDFFDLDYLATHFEFNRATFAEAVRRTFARRRTPMPADAPIGLTLACWENRSSGV